MGGVYYLYLNIYDARSEYFDEQSKDFILIITLHDSYQVQSSANYLECLRSRNMAPLEIASV